MEIRYIVGCYSLENEESYIELYISRTLSKEEIEILKKCRIPYEYLENNILKLTVIDYIAYLVKVIEEEDRISLKKTEWYYEYIREVSHIEDRENLKSLVISQNGIKIEILILEEVNEFR